MIFVLKCQNLTIEQVSTCIGSTYHLRKEIKAEVEGGRAKHPQEGPNVEDEPH